MRVRELIEQLQQIDDNGGGDMWIVWVDCDESYIYVRDAYDIVYVAS